MNPTPSGDITRIIPFSSKNNLKSAHADGVEKAITVLSKINYATLFHLAIEVVWGWDVWDFFQCSNFSYCDYTIEEFPDCRKGFLRKGKITYQCSKKNCSFSATICTLCDDGYLVKIRRRNGGYFFGCINYSRCTYIQPALNIF